MKIVPVSLAFVVASLVVVGCGHPFSKVEHIELEQTPPAVMDGFHREFPGLRLSHTDRITLPGGKVEYYLKFRDAESDYRRKEFSADGTLLDSKWDVKLPPATMPGK